MGIAGMTKRSDVLMRSSTVLVYRLQRFVDCIGLVLACIGPIVLRTGLLLVCFGPVLDCVDSLLCSMYKTKDVGPNYNYLRKFIMEDHGMRC